MAIDVVLTSAPVQAAGFDSRRRRRHATPEVLAGILALLGLAVLGQFAVTSARRRRRDFAISAVTPLPLVILAPPCAVLAANVITFPSGRHAAHQSPAAVLRSE